MGCWAWDVWEHFMAARDAMRLLAFTRDLGDGVELRDPRFNSSWARPRMWEQYGDNHTGACLLFDRDRVEATLRNDVGDDNLYTGDVRYEREGIARSKWPHFSDERIFDPDQ